MTRTELQGPTIWRVHCRRHKLRRLVASVVSGVCAAHDFCDGSACADVHGQTIVSKEPAGRRVDLWQAGRKCCRNVDSGRCILYPILTFSTTCGTRVATKRPQRKPMEQLVDMDWTFQIRAFRDRFLSGTTCRATTNGEPVQRFSNSLCCRDAT